jgi:AraC-like DNA-binding protein
MADFPAHRTFLPHGRPFLLGEKLSSDLVYLSWGRRTYGTAPIPITCHEGWVYLLVRSGAPLFLRPGRPPRRIRAGSCLVVDPDCASGWSDARGARCDVLTWVWRQNPGSTMLQTPCAIFHLEDKAIRRLAGIHERCREQISRPDGFTPRTLQAYRDLIEVDLERSRLSPNPAAQSRLEFALAWLERHWSEESAVSRLAEYLQISHSSLDRLFKRELRHSVASWIHSRKMERATAMITEGKLRKKEIAFALGYQHANDFSRAWGKWTARLNSPPKKI